MERHAQRREPGHGIGDSEAAQDIPDDGRLTAGEVTFGDDGIRDIASRTAADENLGARLGRAVQNKDREVGIQPACENCSCEPRRARADDDDVVLNFDFYLLPSTFYLLPFTFLPPAVLCCRSPPSFDL